ncbi:MAG: tRNA pseudouridine synthase A [Thermoplasmata archaeon]
MSRWLVRFGYDGAGFAGWARQPGLRTVEGVLREGIPRTGVVPTIEAAGLAVASRTDRGVSARGNALTLTTALPAMAVLRALNGIAPEIFFTAISQVPLEFSARAASGRRYRYFEPAGEHHLERWQDAAAKFRGEVDVRSFGRDLPAERPAVRTIEAVRVHRAGARWLVVDVRAPSFVWGMVRKIIAALRKVDEGTLSLARLEGALRGEHRLTLPLAEPEGLVLWDVTYPVQWSREWGGPNRAQVRYLADRVRLARVREVIGRELSQRPIGAKGRRGR